MTERILFVDDEARVLQAIRRNLHKEFNVATAEGGRQALELMRDEGHFAVVVSDMQMPEMNGLEFLDQVKSRWPDTVRMMLTGNNDQETAVNAVNRGEVFRFLNKPCNADGLRVVLKLAIKQYKLITAERELLEETLRGSVSAVSEILSITKPELFGSMSRIRNRTKQLCEQMRIEDAWQIDTAAMLCQIGCVSLAEETMQKVQAGACLTRDETKSLETHPLLGAELLSNIPRLESVSDIILYQNKNFDGTGYPRDAKKGDEIPLGARILKVVVDADRLLQRNWSEASVLAELQKQSGRYDATVLEAMAECITEKKCTRRVKISSLVDGMIIEEEIVTAQGMLLVCSGQAVTSAIRRHLQKFAASGALTSAILVSDGEAKNVQAA